MEVPIEKTQYVYNDVIVEKEILTSRRVEVPFETVVRVPQEVL